MPMKHNLPSTSSVLPPERSIDPVCGMTVADDHAAATAVHDGKTIRFCSQSCADRFHADPLAYLSRDDAAKKSSHSCCGGSSHDHSRVADAHRPQMTPPAPARIGSGAVSYVCPMHPHVRQSEKGQCPECGMDLEPEMPTIEPTGDGEEGDFAARLKKTWFVAAIVVLSAMARHLTGFDPLHAISPSAPLIFEMVLTAYVMIVGGRPFFERAVSSLRQRRAGMFTLIALGTGAAFLQGVVATIVFLVDPPSGGHPPVYFESAAAIIGLTLAGQIIELRARRKTGDAVRKLLRLSPPTVLLVGDDGREIEVPLESVAPGDRLLVRPGSTIPVDGRVVQGESYVDRSLLTGESMPVRMEKGSAVTGGTMNQSGALTVVAEKVGSETYLAKITQMVATAQRSRSPIQDVADRFAARFVPIVLLTAVATLLFWWIFGAVGFGGALQYAVAVLIVACPCAVGLAVPMSVMVGVGRGAAEGILVRDAAALEALAAARTIVFDKTGTLTIGKPTVVDVRTAPGFDENAVLSAAAAVERGSEHPLARAIVAAAESRSLSIRTADRVTSTPGSGVGGDVGGIRVDIGSERHLENLGIATESLLPTLAEMRKSGTTGIMVAIDRKIAAVLACTDPLKPEAARTVARLEKLGLGIALLSGDDPVTARAIGRELGIDDVVGGALPDDKGRKIDDLRRKGLHPVMVGDGTNDAPALAVADVGIALGTGTDIAAEAAGITIVGGRIEAVADAVVLARAVKRNARQNLWAAFLYNALTVPAAAGVLSSAGIEFSPMTAALTMSLSSISVIANALRLRHR